MSYDLLSKTEPRARKEHRCIWCGQKILVGQSYVRERSVFDGGMQNHAWHWECWDDAQTNNDEPEWEFTPYSYERPGGRVAAMDANPDADNPLGVDPLETWQH